MKKIVHIFALIILLIGSSFDTLEIFAPQQSSVYNSAENSQKRNQNCSRELVNDEIIINRYASQIVKKAEQFFPKGFIEYEQKPGITASAPQQFANSKSIPLQEPGYGKLFLYQLF